MPGSPFNTRTVVDATQLSPNQVSTATVTLASQGNENGIGFSLDFEPSQVTALSVLPGPAAAQATFYVNTNNAAAGKLGIVLALNPGETFPAGASDVARVTFKASPTASGSFQATFGNGPVIQEVCDAYALALPTSFEPMASGTNDIPPLSISRAGQAVQLSWRTSPGNFILEQSAGGKASVWVWTDTLIQPALSNSEWIVTLPAVPDGAFFRLSPR